PAERLAERSGTCGGRSFLDVGEKALQRGVEVLAELLLALLRFVQRRFDRFARGRQLRQRRFYRFQAFLAGAVRGSWRLLQGFSVLLQRLLGLARAGSEVLERLR